MRLRPLSILLLVLLIALGGGAVFLVLWEPKAPTRTIERTIPDDKLPR